MTAFAGSRLNEKMNKPQAGLQRIFVIAAAVSITILVAQVGYRLCLSAACGFKPYANHVASFADTLLCIGAGGVLFALLQVVKGKSRRLHTIHRIGWAVFLATVLAFLLMRKLNLVSTYEEFIAHGV